jgi:hypothetical protein
LVDLSLDFSGLRAEAVGLLVSRVRAWLNNKTCRQLYIKKSLDRKKEMIGLFELLKDLGGAESDFWFSSSVIRQPKVSRNQVNQGKLT